MTEYGTNDGATAISEFRVGRLRRTKRGSEMTERVLGREKGIRKRFKELDKVGAS